MKKMIIEGTYNKASVFASIVETEALKQIEEICNQPFTEGSHIAVMPDVHSGKGCTIGLTMTLGDKICPNLVGVDIGCGMTVIKLGNKNIDFPRLDEVIHTYIPSGNNSREYQEIEDFKNSEDAIIRSYTLLAEDCINALKARVKKVYELMRIGTLGSGNHFLEIDQDSEGNNYLIVHSGSRHLGVAICEYYMSLANEGAENSLTRREELIKEMIKTYKEEGRQKEIQKEKKRIIETFRISEPSDLAYIEGQDYLDYLNDMRYAQKFADINRKMIAYIICKEMELVPVESWSTIHNYIDLENLILRKGAISLKKGEKAIIPINMKEGALIVEGKGNKDYNFSGPHGAGRLMSRSEARKTISLEDFKESMEGIYTTSVCEETLDESAFAYKSISDILPNLEPTAKVLKVIKPIYNFKAKN